MILMKINKYTLGIFIDLNKAIDTLLDHDILLQKQDKYGIKEKNLKLFHRYLTNRKQFMKYSKQNTRRFPMWCTPGFRTRAIAFSHIGK